MPAPSGAAGGAEADLVTSLFSIAKSTRAFLALLLTEIGLHPGQDQLLDRLEMDQPISVSVLADRLAVRPSTVSKMLDRLIEKGLVYRTLSDGDARRTMVALTEDGRAMQADIREIWQRLETELRAALPVEEQVRIGEALQRIDGVIAVRLRRLR